MITRYYVLLVLVCALLATLFCRVVGSYEKLRGLGHTVVLKHLQLNEVIHYDLD